nr:tetratricopeptide repeat protein [Myxococcota bacterium]
DQGWLELRLIDPSATDLVQARKRELERRLARAEQAVNAALAASPKEVAPSRAEVDVLRMKGELEKARQKSAPLAERSTDPANAYVLAALDFAEDSPKWDGVIERLRIARNGEAGGGRAQAALVYVLARAGRTEDAQAELAKIGPSSPMAPLLPQLKAFVARAPKGSAASASARPAARAPAAPAARAPAGEANAMLDKAQQATRSGRYAAAEELYYRVLERSPGNARALSGLAEIARRKNDTARAEELKERARLDASNNSKGDGAAQAKEPDEEPPAAPKSEPAPGNGSNPSPTLPPEVDTTDLPGSKP